MVRIEEHKNKMKQIKAELQKPNISPKRKHDLTKCWYKMSKQLKMAERYLNERSKEVL